MHWPCMWNVESAVGEKMSEINVRSGLKQKHERNVAKGGNKWIIKKASGPRLLPPILLKSHVHALQGQRSMS